MELDELRRQIDEIDASLTALFEKRMDVAAQIAAYKKEHQMQSLDAGREREVLTRAAMRVSEEKRSYVSVLYSLLFELSRSYQDKLLHPTSALREEVTEAIAATPNLFPQYAKVACQGVEGAYSQIACEKFFDVPNIMYFGSFEGVFSAIEAGMCDYGVLPIENSTAGSVKKVYDLMLSHNFRIVRSTRLKIDHNLLARPGTKLSQVKEIFSHEQAIAQCSDFLQTLPGVKVTVCANTAMAAKMVAESERDDVAALASRACADLYPLVFLARSVQDKGNNYTRFLCISRKLEIYPGADRTSLMMILPHKKGVLYKVLARFFALGINLTKLESRPIPDRDFEVMFYFDLETPIYSPQYIQLITELENLCEEFRYLGSYSEVV